jgi:hypothetical protein
MLQTIKTLFVVATISITVFASSAQAAGINLNKANTRINAKTATVLAKKISKDPLAFMSLGLISLGYRLRKPS